MNTTNGILSLGLYEHLKSTSLINSPIPEGARWQEETLTGKDHNIPELLAQFFSTQLIPALDGLKKPVRAG